MHQQYDLIILGAGTTAYAAARMVAEQNRKVLMIEQSQVGGTCVNWGCVPSKTLIHKAEMYYAAQKGERWGLNLSAGRPDCPTLMDLKRTAVETLRNDHYRYEAAHTKNLDLLYGRGRFVATDEIEVENERFRAPDILIATGGKARVAPIPGLETVKYLTYHSALHLPCFPKSLIILGGGVISLEMGQMFARFGTHITILERGPKLLAEFDPRLTEQFRAMLQNEGIRILFNAEAERLEQSSDHVCLHARIDNKPTQLCAERFMFAIGTTPATEDLGLEEVCVATDKDGFIKVDNQLRTNVPGIWAAGDVTGNPMIAPAGAREAQIVAKNILDPQTTHSIDHRCSPMAVFVDPEFATVGLNREQAETQGYQVVTTYLGLDRVPKAHVMGEKLGGFLLNAELGSGKVLGVQMLCPRAADIIHEAALAVRFGLTVVDLTTTVHVYPSISDGLRQAAQENAFTQGLL
ncbi:NAD(P)/FAD-dependent oxidoreductase [Malonomonas rubra]|uniref:dihydrolipoyl dehydrogenase family protein n=1 Tax=Malonomonas rubra TaxID=57040 RepID=UPI0026EF0EC5|nr:NAD(P)/FAD-dependent oxidoreductase [Malonomonas rubra]